MAVSDYPYYKIYCWEGSQMKLATDRKFSSFEEAVSAAKTGVVNSQRLFRKFGGFPMYVATFTEPYESTLTELKEN